MDSVVRDFHKRYYDSKVWLETKWMGIPVAKCPLDLWIYQEIMCETLPDIIIETGTWCGGSAFYLAYMMRLIESGNKVITIDITEKARQDIEKVNEPKILALTGSSTDNEIIEKVKREIFYGARVMVILDSNHSKSHVLEELEVYAPLVSPGCYLIVEDTNINGNPVFESHGPGPMEAIAEWLHVPGVERMFERDRTREKFLLTFNPKGYYRRRR